MFEFVDLNSALPPPSSTFPRFGQQQILEPGNTTGPTGGFVIPPTVTQHHAPRASPLRRDAEAGTSLFPSPYPHPHPSSTGTTTIASSLLVRTRYRPSIAAAPRRPFVNQHACPSSPIILPPLMTANASSGVAYIVKSPPCRAVGRGHHADGAHPPPQSSVLPPAPPFPIS
ncbi:hypothetical protein GALMADRAFT_143399 [Galerina marginata CBS 339.88]|uniref:Uncharacterized protein n=1 Tax=Galerina marginata (strain CBS 339.88) TaxID=685588 RepID=A0A067SMA8_GALM3|nr:hypothetical protein GALMADRAFT_143399 [Galerina marginata CBS 339.88]